MTTNPHIRLPAPDPMIRPFPIPGSLVLLAYRELHIAVNGTKAQQNALGNHTALPRPWEPATCLNPGLRNELWQWLEDVVIWLNHDYTWDTSGLIPNCWPLHPHLVHEIAALADQRRRASLAKTSDALEEWHRYCLPAFTDRMRNRIRAHCDDEHQHWPGRPRHHEHLAETTRQRRQDTYAGDVDALATGRGTRVDHEKPRIHMVDLNTGEIHDDQSEQSAQPRTRTQKGPRV